uniref:ethanolamine kinase n=1 Tax=Electrophorus electricus TaxID=8005 RepID=A0A4W4ESM2_ELEEL
MPTHECNERSFPHNADVFSNDSILGDPGCYSIFTFTSICLFAFAAYVLEWTRKECSTMQADQIVSERASDEALDKSDKKVPIMHIPTVTEGTGTRMKRDVLNVEKGNPRTPFPRGANGDEDSEAESYRDGRTGEVDRRNQDHFRGLSNLLYKCSLPDHVKTVGVEPSRVLLRIYGGVDSLVSESVMFAIWQSGELGPRLYGIFPEGRLEQYIPSKRLYTDQLQDPGISAEIASKMARFHRMVMPFNKEPRWLFMTIDRVHGTNHDIKFVREAHIKKFKKLMKYDLPAELANLRTGSGFISLGNILMRDGQDQNSSDKLMLIDFEYSSYNYRGFDLGNHFCEWIYDYTYDQWPFLRSLKLSQHSSVCPQLHFFRNYLAESEDPIQDQDTIEEEMIIEANRFGYCLNEHDRDVLLKPSVFSPLFAFYSCRHI